MKIFLLIVILFCKTYGAIITELEEHGAYVIKFHQHLCVFTGCSLAENPTSIPYENLSENQLEFLKVAIYGATCPKMPNNFAKEVARFSQMAEIRLQSHLMDLAQINNNDLKFESIRKLATDTLTALKIIEEAKPHMYQKEAMRQWIENWKNAMQILDKLNGKILELLTLH